MSIDILHNIELLIYLTLEVEAEINNIPEMNSYTFMIILSIMPTQQTRDVNQCCFKVGPPSSTLSQH